MSNVHTSPSKASSDSTFPLPTLNTAPTSVSGSVRDNVLFCPHGCSRAQSFKRLSEWKKHDREFHQGRVFRCRVCGSEEKRRYNLKKEHGNCTGVLEQVEVTKVFGCGMCLVALNGSKAREDHIVLDHQRRGAQRDDWDPSREIRSLLRQPSLNRALWKKPWCDDLERLCWDAKHCELLKNQLEEGQFLDPDLVLENAYQYSSRDEKKGFDTSLFPEQRSPPNAENAPMIVVDGHESQYLVDSFCNSNASNFGIDEQSNANNSVLDPSLSSIDPADDDNAALTRTFDLTDLNSNDADPFDAIDPSLISPNNSSNFMWMRPVSESRDYPSPLDQASELFE